LPAKQIGETNPNAVRDRRSFIYDYIDGTLFINPVPIQAGDSLRLVVWRRVPSIAATDSLSLIPQQYRYPVAVYVAWQIARGRQHGAAEELHQAYIEALGTVNASLNGKGTSVAPTE
jgi:hypothetical protein